MKVMVMSAIPKKELARKKKRFSGFFTHVKFKLMPNCPQFDAGNSDWDIGEMIAESKSWCFSCLVQVPWSITGVALLPLVPKEHLLKSLDKVIWNQKKTMKGRSTTPLPPTPVLFSDSVISEKVINGIVNEFYTLYIYIFCKVSFLTGVSMEGICLCQLCCTKK